MKVYISKKFKTLKNEHAKKVVSGHLSKVIIFKSYEDMGIIKVFGYNYYNKDPNVLFVIW